MLNDIRFALRTLGRSRVFAASAVLVLALGIGVNATVFSLANGALLRSRSGIQSPERVAWLSSVFLDTGRRAAMSYPDYLDYRAGTTSVFADLAAYRNVPISLGSGGTPERARGQMVSGSFFPMLGAPLERGRGLTPQDDVRGGPAVALISDALWKRRFGGSADVLTTPIVLNGRDFAIVGVVGPAFRGPAIGDAADIWLPMALWPAMRTSERTLLDSRASSWLTVLARLRPGVSLRQAQGAVSAVVAQLAARYPQAEEGRAAVVTDLGSAVSPEGRTDLVPMAGLLLTVAAFVLLIACANVANLLLARGAGRQLEISVRSSLGASRRRHVRQLLTESAVLATAGALGGLLFASWTGDVLVALAGPELEGISAVPDLRVVLFTAAAAAFSIVVSSIVPAFAATRRDVLRGLRATPNAGGRSRLQGGFVVTQLALSLVLLLAAGLSVRGLQEAGRIDLGFTPDNLTTASYDLVLQNYPEPRREAFRRELGARLRGVAGVEAVTIANLAPLSGMMIGGRASAGADDRGAMTFFNAVGPEYFSTLRMPIVRGRAIDERDVAGAPRAVVVNQTLARRLWGDEEPLGRTIHLFTRTEETVQVVGLARDAKYDDPAEDREPFLYLALAQEPAFDSETVFVRTAAGAANTGAAIERTIRALDAALPIYDVRPFDQILRDRADKQRGMSLLFSAFGALALVLAAVGIYGVMSYATARRARELGVRLALGASPDHLAGMIARDGLWLGGLGTAIGAAAGLPLARALGGLLFGVSAGDVAVFAAVCGTLNVVVLAAALLPARRAARLDPITALRME